ncbi:hypothetical protein LCX93_01725 [Sulfurimonas sp. SWIR-19]|uniref:hypothetical protein n=1 Tax=Sulfurimonas sp. SWIR-19 TaxID=2878390 RepID=UPI001CF3BD25|nr:hypothetical protein [Sulfurimonas sp. SWIR-19]UCN00656.1 hypothetical protein LCX93_01725 [Sulfurimonas sp. SWIR-19]
MDFFLKHKIMILRSVGALMLLIGFAAHFWTTPKTVVSETEIAAANVARMEASVKGDVKSLKKAKPDVTTFRESLMSAQEQQQRYLTVFAMILGVLFLAYSFVKKEQD